MKCLPPRNVFSIPSEFNLHRLKLHCLLFSPIWSHCFSRKPGYRRCLLAPHFWLLTSWSILRSFPRMTSSAKFAKHFLLAVLPSCSLSRLSSSTLPITHSDNVIQRESVIFSQSHQFSTAVRHVKKSRSVASIPEILHCHVQSVQQAFFNFLFFGGSEVN